MPTVVRFSPISPGSISKPRSRSSSVELGMDQVDLAQVGLRRVAAHP